MVKADNHKLQIDFDFGVLGHLCSWNDVIMSWVIVDADSHRKLIPVSTLDLFKVFEHIDMLLIGIC